MATALVIGTDGTVSTVDLPADWADRYNALRELVGGQPESARYHRDALLYVDGDGAGHQDSNLVAWALASAWRGLDLPYGLAGTVVATGPAEEDPLPDVLIAQAHAASEAVALFLGRALTRRPASPDALASELLEAVRLSVAAAGRAA
ncbi:MAG: hypothetical protein HOV68_13090 [Streptomycetaceae bacterium]|nr:hypothetical protein [Streptomycetaceae bacterium]